MEDKENLVKAQQQQQVPSIDEGYLSCTEIFCDTAIEDGRQGQNAQQQQQQQPSYPKVLQVRAEVDPTLAADCRVLSNLIKSEERYLPSNPDYFRYIQQEVKPHMRKIVADWMLEVCQELCCPTEVFCLAMNLMDRFLARTRIRKSQLQLLGAVCLFLSSKFKETAPIPSEKLVMYTDFSVSLEEIREWELYVLHKLKWDLCSVTALDYLDHVLPRLSLPPSVDPAALRQHVETVAALCSTHYAFSYARPSVVCSSAIAVSVRCLLPRFSAPGARTFLHQLQTLTHADTQELEECSTAVLHTLPPYLTSPLDQKAEQQQQEITDNEIIPDLNVFRGSPSVLVKSC